MSTIATLINRWTLTLLILLDLGVKFEGILKKGCNESFSSEREFREKVVIKLLECLGWEENEEVRIEFPISTGETTLRVDYLVGDGVRKFALEIKTPDVSIGTGTNPRTQILSYLNLLKGVRYGVLYNGKEMLIFKKDIDEPLITWSCGDPVSSITYLSKISFPQILDSAFPDQGDVSKELKYSKQSTDPFTIKQGRIKDLKLIGYFSVSTFFLGIISVLLGSSSIGAVLGVLFFFSFIAFVYDYVRLRFIYRGRWK